ncbi:MHS family alpha-ketoglutarate permease-like MFS transporter [Sphingomonas kaistensis]|uniref:MHS family alpha-ketoglutarate permease-like MFS transporter n=1 Tax=Sphingomonas kaistensis TaxID=298708 RepID=A0A7X6BG64_9SPHN|nr:MFS transporter [Sphingomonas kaistensis]NJC04731.1 MHS family alpha-ketoglutarate permease-like MFS transporter [Sphingomonas kaistensis]
MSPLQTADTAIDTSAETSIQDQLSSKARPKAILGGATGNLVEWYDWYAYAAFTLYFAPHFFPSADPTAQLLGAAAVFAVGFFMRPLGAWMMGIYADRRGRKSGLALSVTLMCAGSLLIAVAPTYESVGLFAPAVLLVARLLQGLSVGGEYGASATYLSEMAGKKRRGFFSSFQYVTLIGGQLVAIGVLLLLQAVMSESDLEAWGWRIPFAIGAVLAVVVFWIRRGLAETESFKNAQQNSDVPRSGALALFRHHPREAMTVMLLTAGGTLAFYAYSIYMQKFLVNTSGFSRETASQINGATLFIFMLLQPLAGALSDRIGRKPLLIGFGLAGMLCTYPLFSKLETTRDPLTAFLLVMGGLVIVTGYTSINAVVKAELFPAHIRALGVALPYALANTVFGGTAEYVALRFKDAGWERGFYWYVTAMIAVSLIVYIRMKDTRDSSAIVED